MDIRWLKILLRRGRLKPEATALGRLDILSQQIRTRRVTGKYKRDRDLLRLPRNPAEKAARLELALLTTDEVPAIKLVKEQTQAERKDYTKRLLDYIAKFKMVP